MRPLPFGETFGERYIKINEIINDIAKKSNLSLWQMDHVWDIIGKFRNEGYIGILYNSMADMHFLEVGFLLKLLILPPYIVENQKISQK